MGIPQAADIHKRPDKTFAVVRGQGLDNALTPPVIFSADRGLAGEIEKKFEPRLPCGSAKRGHEDTKEEREDIVGDTKIEWATKVWNPVTGCTKVSAGCKNCYAERIAKRFWGERKFGDVMMHRERVEEPLHWKKPRRVFVDSMSDLFHEKVLFSFLDHIFCAMEAAPQHTFMILTKRPERMLEYMWRVVDLRTGRWSLPGRIWTVKQWPLPNVWLGVSVENQKAAEERIPLLLQVPAVVRFLSVEPMIGKIDLEPFLQFPPLTEGYKMTYGLDVWRGIDWVICGCESGPGARPMEVDWVRSLRDPCHEAEVPFFLKQMVVDGKLAKEPELDGRQWLEFPEVS